MNLSLNRYLKLLMKNCPLEWRPSFSSQTLLPDMCDWCRLGDTTTKPKSAWIRLSWDVQSRARYCNRYIGFNPVEGYTLARIDSFTARCLLGRKTARLQPIRFPSEYCLCIKLLMSIKH